MRNAWLSLLGLYDRDRMTVCPPELFLLPAWAPLAADLMRDHTVIVPDLRGIGRSSIPANGYDKKTQAQDIRAVVTSEDAGFCRHWGIDFGAIRESLRQGERRWVHHESHITIAMPEMAM